MSKLTSACNPRKWRLSERASGLRQTLVYFVEATTKARETWSSLGRDDFVTENVLSTSRPHVFIHLVLPSGASSWMMSTGSLFLEVGM